MTEFGVYIHIPFCLHHCDYCAFAIWTDRAHLVDAYARACRSEIQRADLPAATSVYFGGGTPSLLPGELLASILDCISLVPGAEVTVECNPDTVSADFYSRCAEAGVNRISMGAQSMLPHVLRSLGRIHPPESVRSAVELAGENGISNISVDLVFGAVGESVEDWRASLNSVLDLSPAPTHVSAYGLTVEKGTVLAADQSRYPNDDDQADKYLIAEQVLAERGLFSYEVSNWAKPGFESRHNQLYWDQGDYRGIGCAAHSHASGHRWWNVRTPERYISKIEENKSPVAGEEFLEQDQRRLEGLALSLRTRNGVPAEALGLFNKEMPNDLELHDLMVVRDGRVVLNATGRLLADELTLHLR